MKHTARFLSLSLSLALCLGLGACASRESSPPPSDSAELPAKTSSPTEPVSTSSAPIPAPSSLDPNLVGIWHQASAEHKGNENIDFGIRLFFLPDGTFYGPDHDNRLSNYEGYLSQEQGIARTSTDEGSLNLAKDALQYALATGAMTQEEIASIQLEVTYQLSDIQVSSTGDELSTLFHQRFDNDLLTIHITGTHRTSSTTVLTIDTTLIYEKEYPMYGNEDFLYPLLAGDWTDNMGNTWSFFYEKGQDDYTFKFKMTDSENKPHNGTILSKVWHADDPECKERLKFAFEDFETEFHTVISCDTTQLIMNGEAGDLNLTRK